MRHVGVANGCPVDLLICTCIYTRMLFVYCCHHLKQKKKTKIYVLLPLKTTDLSLLYGFACFCKHDHGGCSVGILTEYKLFMFVSIT